MSGRFGDVAKEWPSPPIDAGLPAEVTLRNGRVWSNVSVAETVAILERAKTRLLGNMIEPVPSERGKEELQT